MLTHSTRRWLAGLGVAGAFVAASATPAVAAGAAPHRAGHLTSTPPPSPPRPAARRVSPSPRSPRSRRAPTTSRSRYDYRRRSTVSSDAETRRWDCDPSPGVLRCTEHLRDRLVHWASAPLHACDMNADRQARRRHWQAQGHGQRRRQVRRPASHTAKVRIGEGVDLAAPGQETKSRRARRHVQRPADGHQRWRDRRQGRGRASSTRTTAETPRQAVQQLHLRRWSRCGPASSSGPSPARRQLAPRCPYVARQGQPTRRATSTADYNWMTPAEFEDFQRTCQATALGRRARHRRRAEPSRRPVQGGGARRPG